MLPEPTADCFRSHLGVWAILPSYLQESLGAIRDRVEYFNNKKLTPTGETVMKMAR